MGREKSLGFLPPLSAKITSCEEQIIKFLVNPSIAIGGSVIFAFVWVVSGLTSEYSNIGGVAAIEEVAHGKWSTDGLGHVLAAGALLASFAFACYGPSIRRILPLESRQWSDDRLQFLRRWFRMSLVIMLSMTTANIAIVSFTSVAEQHWAHRTLPYVLPAANASLYYLATLFPLLLSLLNLSKDLEYASQSPKSLVGYEPLDPQKCFGISAIGNAIVVTIFIFLYFLVIPVLVQINAYGRISPPTIISAIFFAIIFRRICIDPLTKLQGGLWEERLKALHHKKEELVLARAQYEKDKGHKDYHQTVREEYQLILEQRLIPFLKPFAFLSAFVAIAATVTTLIKWAQSNL